MAAPIDARDLARRHPLCPMCGYDLVAAIAANTRVCPECGEAFEPADLRYEHRPGDWSNAVAIQRTLVALGGRVVLATVLSVATSALAIELLNLQVPRVIPFLIAVVQACAVGAACSRRLVDQTGFESVMLIFGACFAATSATVFGYVFAAQWIIAPKLAGIAFMHVGVSLMGAMVWIIHHMLVNE